MKIFSKFLLALAMLGVSNQAFSNDNSINRLISSVDMSETSKYLAPAFMALAIGHTVYRCLTFVNSQNNNNGFLGGLQTCLHGGALLASTLGTCSCFSPIHPTLDTLTIASIAAGSLFLPNVVESKNLKTTLEKKTYCAEEEEEEEEEETVTTIVESTPKWLLNKAVSTATIVTAASVLFPAASKIISWF